jgi:membrane-associated phospholipid phosphatase
LSAPEPTRVGTSSLWLLAAALALSIAAGGALAIDLPIARAVRESKGPGDLVRLVRLAEAFAYGGSVAILIVAAATLDPRGWRVAPRLVICAFGAGLAADLVKLLVVARLRPAAADLNAAAADTFVAWLPPLASEPLQQVGLQYSSTLQSFPSAHTATAVGLAIALTALYPRGWWLFTALAIISGAQRMVSQSHFLSDVLAGAAIGCLVGAISAASTPVGRWLRAIEQGDPSSR